jgi:hypothetical protein
MTGWRGVFDVRKKMDQRRSMSRHIFMPIEGDVGLAQLWANGHPVGSIMGKSAMCEFAQQFLSPLGE